VNGKERFSRRGGRGDHTHSSACSWSETGVRENAERLAGVVLMTLGLALLVEHIS